ncbi:MAG: molybdopterin molybdotransferase MoeA [Actinomycetota bacterium]|nr:molybdopterin molybdotransferase MoeA [Actinomycetota bacterium]MDI6821306.1 molybdopterin molybdotransferase MoeA [Actinomycetota bacterium]
MELISPEEAKSIVLNEVKTLSPCELDILDSLGSVLAQDVVSDMDIPPFDNSAMDGFAVKASDTKGASKENPVRLKIVDYQPAGGVTKIVVTPGVAVKVMTGALIPKGADAVIRVEDTQTSGEWVYILQEVKEGQDIRLAGEDVRKGETVIRSGTVIGPSQIGILASLGKSKVMVLPHPSVAILCTGDELVEIDEPLPMGKIRDSNSYSTAAQVIACGARPVRLGIARDTVESIGAKLREALHCDVIVTTAGVSVGEHDIVKDVLEDLGAELKFWRVAQRPGMPLAFWMFKGKPVFGLPGNPGASMICFEEYVRPALLKMMGRTKLFRPEIEAVLTQDIKKKPGRMHYVRVRVERKNGEYYATSAGPQGSGILKTMSLANGLALIPKDAPLMKAGERVRVHLIDMPEDH